MKKIVSFILIISTLNLVVACGGRTPVPVAAYQYGDDNKSCQTLQSEMHQAQNEMSRLLPKTNKTGKNVALGVAGVFFIVPWFFMDFKEAEQTEYEAYRQRYNNLATIAMNKRCGIEQVHYPSVEELKAEVAKLKAEQQKKEAGK